MVLQHRGGGGAKRKVALEWPAGGGWDVRKRWRSAQRFLGIRSVTRNSDAAGIYSRPIFFRRLLGLGKDGASPAL